MLVGNKVGKLDHVRFSSTDAHQAWPNTQVDMEAARQVDYQAAKVRHSCHKRLPLSLSLPLALSFHQEFATLHQMIYIETSAKEVRRALVD
jgi:hypothetical protein